MASNSDVAEQFEEIADRMLLQGESWFKVSAYRRAAETIKALEEPVERVAARHGLRRLPGIGDAISAKIESYLETGHIPLLDRLGAQQPPGLLALMRVTGLPPRRVRALAAGPLRIDSIERLQQAIADGLLEGAETLDADGLRAVREWSAKVPEAGISGEPTTQVDGAAGGAGAR